MQPYIYALEHCVHGTHRGGTLKATNHIFFFLSSFFFLAQTKMSWRSLLTSQYSR